MNIGGVGSFAGGLAGGYLAGAHNKRLGDYAARQKELYDRGVANAQGVAAKLAQQEIDERVAAQQASGPNTADTSQSQAAQNPDYEPGGSTRGPASNTKIGALLGKYGYHDLAKGVDPNYQRAGPSAAQNPDYEPGGSGPASGLATPGMQPQE